jgi:hypothetical protein
MAGKVGAVMSVTDGYGFSLHDDVRGGNNSSCLTLSYETRELAEAARLLIAEGFFTAKTAEAPPSR